MHQRICVYTRCSEKLCFFSENFQCKISLKPPENGQPITVESYTHILQTKVRQSNAKKNNGEPCMHTKWPLTRRHCALFLERGEGWILRLHDIGSGGGNGREGEGRGGGGKIPRGGGVDVRKEGGEGKMNKTCISTILIVKGDTISHPELIRKISI